MAVTQAKPGTFGHALRHHMDRTGKTTEQLARVTGLTKQGLWYILTGGRDPNLSTARKLAVALGIHLSTLVEGMSAVKLAVNKPASKARVKVAPSANGKPKPAKAKAKPKAKAKATKPKAAAKPKPKKPAKAKARMPAKAAAEPQPAKAETEPAAAA